MDAATREAGDRAASPARSSGSGCTAASRRGHEEMVQKLRAYQEAKRLAQAARKAETPRGRGPLAGPGVGSRAGSRTGSCVGSVAGGKENEAPPRQAAKQTPRSATPLKGAPLGRPTASPLGARHPAASPLGARHAGRGGGGGGQVTPLRSRPDRQPQPGTPATPPTARSGLAGSPRAPLMPRAAGAGAAGLARQTPRRAAPGCGSAGASDCWQDLEDMYSFDLSRAGVAAPSARGARPALGPSGQLPMAIVYDPSMLLSKEPPPAGVRPARPVAVARRGGPGAGGGPSWGSMD